MAPVDHVPGNISKLLEVVITAHPYFKLSNLAFIINKMTAYNEVTTSCQSIDQRQTAESSAAPNLICPF